MTRLAFVDVETTGTDSQRHDIWEVGLVLDVDGQMDWEDSWFLEPDLSKADPKALAMNGFYDRAPNWCRTIPPRWTDPRIVAKRLTQVMRDAIPINCNIHFDLSFLTPFVCQHSGVPSWHYSPVDVKSMAFGRGFRELEPGTSTDKILEHFGIKNDGPNRHTALGDVKLARDLFYAIQGRDDYERA